MSEVKKPTHKQMMKRTSLWFNEYLNALKIVHPDIYTQEHWSEYDQAWIDSPNSSAVIIDHYEFLGWL